MLEFFKRDANRTGIVAAVIFPLAILIITLLVMSKSMSLVSYIQTMVILGSFSKILSLCVYPNLIIFYLYLHYNCNRSAKGVVWGTMIMASIVLIVYLIQKIY
jgi:hypothetical protein